jgi:hypothetical protein
MPRKRQGETLQWQVWFASLFRENSAYLLCLVIGAILKSRRLVLHVHPHCLIPLASCLQRAARVRPHMLTVLFSGSPAHVAHMCGERSKVGFASVLWAAASISRKRGRAGLVFVMKHKFCSFPLRFAVELPAFVVLPHYFSDCVAKPMYTSLQPWANNHREHQQHSETRHTALKPSSSTYRHT